MAADYKVDISGPRDPLRGKPDKNIITLHPLKVTGEDAAPVTVTLTDKDGITTDFKVTVTEGAKLNQPHERARDRSDPGPSRIGARSGISQSVDELPHSAQRQHEVVLRSGAGYKLRALVEVELARSVVSAIDEERSESDVVAQSIGPQEGICEQGCADASSLRALIDGESREEENWAWLRALARFEGIWEFAALYCPHR